MTTLNAKKRESVSKKANVALRAEGKIPAVVYGNKEESTPIVLDTKEFQHAYKEAGESTVVSVSGLGDSKDVLIHEVVVDPVLGHPVHVDLLVVDSKTEVEVAVALEFIGEAPAEKQGGTLIKVLHELIVKALPKDLPHSLEVSVAGLESFEDQIRAQDVALPAGVTLVTEPEEAVALVTEAQEESEETIEFDASAVEVEEKGKKDDEGEAEAEGK